MNYVSGFLAAVSTDRKEEYTAFAARMVSYFKDQGAIRVVEAWGDDVPDGEVTSFPMAVKKQDTESVVFSWIEWPSKDIADAAMEKMQTDPALAEMGDMPFDGQRMIFGGFQMIVDE